MDFQQIIKDRREQLNSVKARIDEVIKGKVDYDSVRVASLNNKRSALTEEIKGLETMINVYTDVHKNLDPGDITSFLITDHRDQLKDQNLEIIDEVTQAKLKNHNISGPGRSLPLSLLQKSVVTNAARFKDKQAIIGLPITPENTPLGRMGVYFDDTPESLQLKYNRYNDFPEAQWLGDGDVISATDTSITEIIPSYKRIGFMLTLDTFYLETMTPAGRDYFVSMQILKALYKAIQKAVINGDGVKEPTGILNDSDISILHAGDAASAGVNANGAALVNKDVEKLEDFIGARFDDYSNLGFLTNIKVRRALKQMPIFSGSSLPMWNELGPYLKEVSSIVPDNLTKGTADDLSAIIFGDWSKITVSMPKGVKVLTDKYSESNKNKVHIVVTSFVGVNITSPSSFVAIKDIIAE